MHEYHGSCGCGSCSFTVKAQPEYLCHCHCNQCQRIHASAFATWVGFYTINFLINDPEQLMTFYRGEYAERGFCGRCGSNFFFRYHNENYPHSEKNEIAFARACFDSDLPKQDASHIFFKEKKDWYIVHDDLPKRD